MIVLDRSAGQNTPDPGRHPSVATAVSSIQSPVVAYLAKPLPYHELRLHVRTSLERSGSFRTISEVKDLLEKSLNELEDLQRQRCLPESGGQPTPAGPPTATIRTGKALKEIVEDGIDNQRLISFLLRKAGADVTLAENGKIAVEKALTTFPGRGRRHGDEKEPFDVILMDMRMPVMDGYEATRRLRREGYHNPIIALTADAMANSREKCTQAGCDDHLTKPFSREELLRLVSSYVDGW